MFLSLSLQGRLSFFQSFEHCKHVSSRMQLVGPEKGLSESEKEMHLENERKNGVIQSHAPTQWQGVSVCESLHEH